MVPLSTKLLIRQGSALLLCNAVWLKTDRNVADHLFREPFQEVVRLKKCNLHVSGSHEFVA